MERNKKKNNFGKSLIFFIIFFIILVSFLNLVRLSSPSRTQEISYTEFLSLVDKGKITRVEVKVGEKGQIISGMLDPQTRFKTFAPEDPDLYRILKIKGVEIKAEREQSPWFANLLGVLFPILIFVGIWIFFLRQMRSTGNRAFSFGKSRARLIAKDEVKITFKDVAGAEEAKEELQEVVQFLKDPGRFEKLGAKIPKGILLVGPPGCGKTLMAKAVAGEAGVPFFSISGSDFVELFVGVGAARVRDLFEQGRKNAPCIIFIDEIDAVGRQRFAGIGGGHDEKEQTLNQLLVELDGFNPREGVIVMGATNRPDVLDPALLRPGRFDRRVVINLPEVRERELILRLHMRGKPVTKEIDVLSLARQTPGFSGADLENLINEASLLAARRGKKEIEMEDLEEAIERVIAGPERKTRLLKGKEKEIVAYHESGHAIVAYSLPHADPIHKISIIPRGTWALGYTLQLPLEDRHIATKSELMDKLTVLLAGRATEELIFKEETTGAQNDLKQAAILARKMVTEYGMSEKLGPLTLGEREEMVFLGRDLVKERLYSEEFAFNIDKEVQRIIGDCYARAKGILVKKRTKLKELAQILLKEEVLEKEKLKKILKKPKSRKTPSRRDEN